MWKNAAYRPLQYTPLQFTSLLGSYVLYLPLERWFKVICCDVAINFATIPFTQGEL